MEQLPANVPVIKSKHRYDNAFITVDAWDSFDKKEEFHQKILKSSTEQIVYLGQNEWDYYSGAALPKFNAALEHLKNQDRIFHIVTSGFPYHKEPIDPNLKVYHWVDWFMKKTFTRCINTSKDVDRSRFAEFRYYSQSLENTTFDHYLTSLNHRSHAHRCHMMDLIAKNNLIEGNAISWHNLVGNGSMADMYDWEYFTPRVLSLSDNFNDEWNTPPTQYFKSFMQVVSESSQNVKIFTEKTAMALISHKPFLIAGPMHIHQTLKDLNFELYDDIFDYSFDNEPNQGKRYQMIMDNFVRIQQENTLGDLVKLQEKIKSKIVYNFENLKKNVFDFSTVPPIVRKIFEVYKITGEDVGHWSNGALACLDDHRREFYK